MRMILAIQVFFQTLFSRQFADRVRRLRAGAEGAVLPSEVPSQPPAEPPRAAPQLPLRNDAISLLAVLQREARLVDIVMEPLGNYSDAQIGAASRDVLRDCGQVLQRLFDLQPVLEVEEGSEYQTPDPLDAGRFRLTGKVEADPPYRGRVVHQGWQARRCELPQWSGSKESRWIVAPAELEIS